MRTIKIRKGDDLHLHLRQGILLNQVILFTMQQFCRATIMPNTDPPIRCAADVTKYCEEIMRAANRVMRGQRHNFKPLMTIEITKDTTPEMIYEAYKAGAVAGKIYPRNQTTNSSGGVSSKGYKKLAPVFDAMQEIGMLLLLHGEVPNYNILGRNREREFVNIVSQILANHCGLKIVFEHITTKEAAEFIRDNEDVAGTITVHHLYLTMDDVIGYSENSGGKMQPHHFCKPIAKDPEDRAALIKAALSGHPRFFYGGDSAPHDATTSKHCSNVCAGVFNSPVAMPLLAELFNNHGKIDRLEDFTSTFGAKWYGLELNDDHIELIQDPWTVPNYYRDVAPFMAGQEIKWQVR